jgi:hypothetical protein
MSINTGGSVTNSSLDNMVSMMFRVLSSLCNFIIYLLKASEQKLESPFSTARCGFFVAKRRFYFFACPPLDGLTHPLDRSDLNRTLVTIALSLLFLLNCTVVTVITRRVSPQLLNFSHFVTLKLESRLGHLAFLTRRALNP